MVSISLRGGKKNKAKNISSLTFLWDIRATNSMVNSKNDEPYDHRIRSNKVDYSISVGPYCMKHDFKVPFCMPEFSIINTILYRFRVYNNKGKSGIVYVMNIVY